VVPTPTKRARQILLARGRVAVGEERDYARAFFKPVKLAAREAASDISSAEPRTNFGARPDWAKTAPANSNIPN
jgi:hypothetical protein